MEKKFFGPSLRNLLTKSLKRNLAIILIKSHNGHTIMALDKYANFHDLSVLNFILFFKRSKIFKMFR